MGMGLGVSSQKTKKKQNIIIQKIVVEYFWKVVPVFNYQVIFFFPVSSVFLRSFLKLQLPLTQHHHN